MISAFKTLLRVHFLSSMTERDDAIRATNDDAASCKRSAVQRGYWSDPYIQYVTKASEHKPPEISRGYYARVKGVQGLIRQFLEVSRILLITVIHIPKTAYFCSLFKHCKSCNLSFGFWCVVKIYFLT